MERSLTKLLPGGGFRGTSAIRSRIMGAIRGTGNKSTERRLRGMLAQAGIKGWFVQPQNLPGNPDFYFPRARLAVFVDGCFWHGCPRCSRSPKTRARFWRAKIERNKFRDRRTNRRLGALGIRTVRLWECALREDGTRCVLTLQRRLATQGTKRNG